MAAQRELWSGCASCVVLILFFIATTDTQICSPHGTEAPGECISAKNCPQLLNAFQPVDVPNFIEQHSCGVESETGDVLVCCLSILAARRGNYLGPPQPSRLCGSKQVNGGALWPFVVGLGYIVPRKDLIAIACNGVLISPQWVLTDPSCFAENVITTAFFGIGRADYDKVTRVSVAHTKRPTDYDSARDMNSIGLVKLVTAVTASDDIQVVCMPPGPDYDPTSPRFVLYIGKIDDGSVAGRFEVRSFWKHEVSLEVCRTSPGIAVFPTRAHLCTNGLQACNTPMARPLLVSLDPAGGGYTIVGVGGLTADRCTSDVTLFTSISMFLPYINRMVNASTAVDQLLTTYKDLLQIFIDREYVDTCGQRTVGLGLPFPFIASLGKGTRVESNNNSIQGEWTYTSFCTGVFLTPVWVLTDARCLQNNAVDHAATAYDHGRIATKYAKVASTMTPPYYTPTRDHNTVALLKLETPLGFTVDTQAICLSRPSSFDNSSSLMALSAGYAFKQAGGLTLASGLRTVERVGNDGCIASRYVTFDPQESSYICTSNINACRFLANPPVIAEEDVDSATFTVVGVGGENANYCKGDFIAHVRVRPHVPWITSIVFPDGDPYNPDVSHLISSFTNNFQPNAPPQNPPPNAPPQNPPPNAPPQNPPPNAPPQNPPPNAPPQNPPPNAPPQNPPPNAPPQNPPPNAPPQNPPTNTPPQNSPSNQPGDVPSQTRDNAPEGAISPSVAANSAPHPASNNQAAPLTNSGFSGFTPRSTSITSPYRIIVFPN